MTFGREQGSPSFRRTFTWSLAAAGLVLAAVITAAMVALGGLSGPAPLWVAMTVPAAFAVWLAGIIAGFLFGLDARLSAETRPGSQ